MTGEKSLEIQCAVREKETKGKHRHMHGSLNLPYKNNLLLESSPSAEVVCCSRSQIAKCLLPHARMSAHCHMLAYVYKNKIEKPVRVPQDLLGK